MSIRNLDNGHKTQLSSVSTSRNDQRQIEAKDSHHQEDLTHYVQETIEEDNIPAEDNVGRLSNSPYKTDVMDGKQAWGFFVSLLFTVIFTGLQTMWNNTFPDSDLVMRLTYVGTLFYAFLGVGVFIGSISYSIFGLRFIHTLAIVLFVSGLILASFSNSIWQLYITFGFMSGTGSAFIITIGYRLIPQWFIKYRSTATGLLISGIPFSGVVYPLLVNKLNVTFGTPWSYRIPAFMFLIAALATYPFIKEPKDIHNDNKQDEEENIPKASREKKLPGKKKQDTRQLFRDILDVSVLKNFNFLLWCTATMIYYYSSIIVTIFVPSSATAIGLSDEQGALGSTILFATAASALIAIVGIERYPAAIGYRTLAGAGSALGPFIAIYLDSLYTNMEPYFYCKIFAGSGFALCVLLALVIKFRLSSKPLAVI
ncbi:major facilitator superfamily domain-containing protein [Phascolomyces articulosus]|uniref:Major facilitator superfamily domain-containing protein n=1 Tax=Phascolomyces articulosus TaxID=60185 RepID=A0AAD5KLE4_9FUNG|nr:major facilitator superfamily domain-containing protein [Phascolomyces articulosus]